MAKERAVGDARNAILSRDSHIWTLRMFVVALMGAMFFLIWVLYQRQSDITVHIPPDLSKGANIKPGVLVAPNSYAFGMYVWRALNDWPDSGSKDYSAAIDKYKCFVSPDFEQWLRKNEKNKRREGELDRTRTITEAVPFNPQFVQSVGSNVFSVALVMRLQERVGGMVVKDTNMNYSLRIVPDNRHCNDMGMAIDGFMIDPTRAEKEAEEKSKKARAAE